ncbi:hypothetical protein IPV08_15990 [Methylobacterium sp. SD274]|uniref:hypothetical protein n=1 Tax=Methylobacterium sp. SD274 TaxID=2782009 RepID=UPI001A96EF7D|nr:hypothetical protein [Methylobacterium sp. SD274]MBO1021462.1 hypothetical protein [Methylobacterium sp. SD274]
MAQSNLPAAKTAVPPVIDTTKLTGARPDPRGDINPGVLTDQPGTPGVNPVTNRDDSLTAEDGVTLRAPTSNEPLNPPIPEPVEDKPSTRYIEMVAKRDLWPRDGNKYRPTSLDDGAEWRVRAGETVKLPSNEAMDLMENDVAERANKREG